MKYYKLISGIYPSFTIGRIYEETSHGDNAMYEVKDYARDMPNNWQLINNKENNMENYMMIDGVKIPLSEETIKSIRNSKKELTLKDILESRKDTRVLYYASVMDNVVNEENNNTLEYCAHYLHHTNKQRAKQLRAVSLMMIVADYLNDKELVYCDDTGNKFIIRYNYMDNLAFLSYFEFNNYSPIVFNTKDKAELAIKILGENTIKLALTGQGDLTNYNL